jgi:hypothetical protein
MLRRLYKNAYARPHILRKIRTIRRQPYSSFSVVKYNG